MRKEESWTSPDWSAAHVATALRELWSQVLELPVERVGMSDNFFAAGGDSLLLAQLLDRINTRFFADRPRAVLGMTDLLTHTTISALVRRITPDRLPIPDSADVRDTRVVCSGSVAVIGMAGRFPGAADLQTLWDNVCSGVESIVSLSDLPSSSSEGATASLLADPHYVGRCGFVPGLDQFDAGYFGLTPREASITCPQQRLLLECAAEALEHAGYGVRSPRESVGVFVGVGRSVYLADHLTPQSGQLDSVDGLTLLAVNSSPATRISYLFNLTGPSLGIDTACSSSLVAVHQAARALLQRDCRMALAGGASARQFDPVGYRYQEGGIVSPDGYCRPFDATAAGTVFTNGSGMVLLKRLEDALRDRDTIYAIIKSSAINNDGNQKAGYAAPSVAGQAQVIRSALNAAQIDPFSIGYLETHGTGTALGDPLEVAALKAAFGPTADSTAQCALGAVKANIGHLEAAAGIAGLIKAVLVLEHGQLPPAVNFTALNAAIDLSGTPFYINRRLTAWEGAPAPRRAGVSSFGIGGTNAHVILEQAPRASAGVSHRHEQLIAVSGNSETALRRVCRDVAGALRSHGESASLADAAFTLQMGRESRAHRFTTVAGTMTAAAEALEHHANAESPRTRVYLQTPQVVFMFPGQGAQYLNMTRGQYEEEPYFRKIVDSCAERLLPLIHIDLRTVLYSNEDSVGSGESANTLLARTDYCQPALFVVEYALARLWQSWGVEPSCMIGHSIGEYVAATLSGVLEVEQALQLVAARGRVMRTAPVGRMLAVRISRDDLSQYPNAGWALAAVNGARECVVSGTVDAIEHLCRTLDQSKIQYREVATSGGFHSPLMDGVLSEFAQALGKVRFGDVGIPYISNLTGQLMTSQAAASAQYWVRHLRETVEFSTGVATLASGPGKAFLEVGPGITLSSLVRKLSRAGVDLVLASTRRPTDLRGDEHVLLNSLGHLWEAGHPIDWSVFNKENRCRRIALPPHPFERRRHWIPSRSSQLGGRVSAECVREDSHCRFYTPTWKRAHDLRGDDTFDATHKPSGTASCCILLDNGDEFGDALAAALSGKFGPVLRVRAGNQFSRYNFDYTLDPLDAAAYRKLFGEVAAQHLVPEVIVHAWSVAHQHPAAHVREDSPESGVYGILYLMQALTEKPCARPVSVTLLASGAFDVTGDEVLCPRMGMLASVATTISHELSGVSCRFVDVEDSSVFVSREPSRLAMLLHEITNPGPKAVVAHRAGCRWLRQLEAVPLDRRPDGRSLLRERGVYLITGGLGSVGMALAEGLARSVRARLALVGRTELPARSEWARVLEEHSTDERIARRIRSIQRMESLGAEVMLAQADVIDSARVKDVIEAVRHRFGAINGVIHAAGIAGGGAIQLRAPDAIQQVMAPKISGTLVLHDAVAQHAPDFLILCSSTAALLGPPGQYDYAAANGFLDAFAHAHDRKDGMRVISINWDAWKEGGMATEAPLTGRLRRDRIAQLADALSDNEGRAALELILSNPLPQWIVSTRDLEETQQQARSPDGTTSPQHPSSLGAPPESPLSILRRMWQELLGVEIDGADADFFELGGDSLLVADLGSRIRTRFGRSLTVRQLVTHPGLRQMAELLVSEHVEGAA